MMPFSQADWPLPQGRQFFAPSNAYRPEPTLATNLPFVNFDWPLPRVPARLEQTWTLNLIEGVLGLPPANGGVASPVSVFFSPAG